MVTPLPLQLVKKVVQSGDTACLQPTLDVFRHEDRQLLQGHCHARALAILQTQPGGAEGRAHTREAIAYLSLAIFAAGRSRPRSSFLRGPHPVPGARGQRAPLPCGGRGCGQAPGSLSTCLAQGCGVPPGHSLQQARQRRGEARPAGT